MNNDQTPSEGELLILQVLWDHPDATVRTVHERLSQYKEVGYTTVLTQLQRMHKKGLVIRNKLGKQHIYRAASERSTVESTLLSRLKDTVFGGSTVKLALRALGDETPSAAELDELQRWLDQQKNT